MQRTPLVLQDPCTINGVVPSCLVALVGSGQGAKLLVKPIPNSRQDRLISLHASAFSHCLLAITLPAV